MTRLQNAYNFVLTVLTVFLHGHVIVGNNIFPIGDTYVKITEK